MNGGDMALFSLNCQSLRAHARDLRGNIVQTAHSLMLSETWLHHKELVEIENFKRITHIDSSVNQKVTNFKDYTHETLLAYAEGGSKLLRKQYHVLPLILGGDLNIDLDKDEGLRLVQLLKSELNLDFVSGKALGTTSFDRFTLSRAETSSCWCGVVVRRGGASSGVVHVT
ncbi:uncharacterized protein TNCV_3818131 [Trichonephila clavipes]|nr:uncharacterized protein TNCV_3818131 [Trichonephila clavipes]